MKKYKLIKEYPGSPKLGTEITKAKDWDHYNFNGGMFGCSISNDIAEDNPDYWQEIKEVEYEVLSLRKKLTASIGFGNIYKVSDYDTHLGTYLSTFPIDSPFYVEGFNRERGTPEHLNENFDIHSVRRISDGEVFTIGDKVTGYTYYEPREILSFTCDDNTFYLKQCKGSTKLKDAKKYFEPLFTTEDGVDIFDGMDYTIVNIEEMSIYATLTAKGYHDRLRTNKKVFSTKEIAQDWIDKNKPVFSVVDILNYLDSTKFPIKPTVSSMQIRITAEVQKHLLQLAKEKVDGK